jgi:5-methyltetrahydropteroyltriglutamate--homocysteine methyltransferase
MQLPPVAATTIGSFPRPAWLARTERGSAEFILDGVALIEAQEDATLLSIKDQETAGLDLVTDGEQRRSSFINHVLRSWDGVDLTRLKPKAMRRRERQTMVPTITGQIRRREPAGSEDIRFAKAIAHKPVKMAVPGPMTIIDSTFDEAYGGDEEAQAIDIATALNLELLDLQAAGVDVLQIDEPAMTRWHEKVEAYGATALDRCLRGIVVPTFVHLCYGYGGSLDTRQYHYEYPELFGMLRQTAISGLSVEFARSGYDSSILAACDGKAVMFGCVDPGDEELPQTNEVVESVRRVLSYVPADRLLIAPDCGMMTVSRQAAQSKASLLARVASEVRDSL